ncbi:MAG: CotH kinase family protein [Clostridia bacterium]|nr:CotH kinase family protein [Clostridia bacterium]
MKYKLIGITAIICAIIISVAVPATGIVSAKERYHQHISAALRPEDEVNDGTFNSHLPLVKIDTRGQVIPGYILKDENGKNLAVNGQAVHALTEDGETTIQAGISIIDNADTVNRPDDEPAITSEMRFRIRGNSSREFDKKSYFVKLIDKEGNNNPQPVMGMDAHHEWALYGPYLDKSLIRNYMWYNIAGELMDYSPNVRFCEVFLDGEYQGLYVMTEMITAGKGEARLPLTVSAKRSTFSGYLLRMDRGSDNPMKNIEDFLYYAKRTQFPIEIVYPGTNNLTPEIAEAIRTDFSDFEKALYSYDFDNAKWGYKNLIDVESFADYFILNEFTCNYDAGWLSTYIYKDIDNRFKMCIWDFNSACQNYEKIQDTRDFAFQNVQWFWMLMKDEDFVNEIIGRYRFLRKNYLSDEYLNNYMDETIAYLGPAIDRNFSVWGYTFEEYRPLDPDYRNPNDHESAVEMVRSFIRERGSWMDRNIESLKQYAKTSKVKKFDEDAN